MRWIARIARHPAGQAVLARLLKLNAWRYRRANKNKEETDMSDLQTIFTEMKQRFDADAAAGVDSVYQYEIDDASRWYVAVADGACQVAQGQHDEPTVTLAMDTGTLQEVMSGETDGMQAFMAGRIRADGNIMEATRLATLFPIG